MKFSENDNIYEFNALNVLEKYAEFVKGTPECMVVVCSSEALPDYARQAITASCEKLDLGECAWLRTGSGPAADRASADAADGSGDDPVGAGSAGADSTGAGSTAPEHLTPQDIFSLVEGLDPVALIAADTEAASALGKAYRCDILLNERNRVFGRTCAAFRNFASMLADPRDKQRAWALLKQLK